MANLRASDLAGLRIRQARQRRDWTAKELADKCAAAGAPHITPTVITNLETRRRQTREITVDELLILAYVLDLPPLQLIVPHDAGEELEVVPGVQLGALAAADWLAGDSGLPWVDSSGDNGAAAPAGHWQEHVARIAGREIRRHRNRKRLSAMQLADLTADLGMPVPRSILADLENGRRDTVSVPEMLVLSAALGVAPMDLIVPIGYDEQIEMLPGRPMDPLEAAYWIQGEHSIDLRGPEVLFVPYAAGESSTLNLAVNHIWVLTEFAELEAELAKSARNLDRSRTAFEMADALVAEAQAHGESAEFIDRLTAAARRQKLLFEHDNDDYEYRTDAIARYRGVAVSRLLPIRAEMRSRGMMLPVLPPSLKSADADEDGANGES